MYSRWLAIAACAVIAGLGRLSAEGLVWERKVIEAAADQGQPEDVKAEFVFRNAGSRPVTITDVETSCGCTTAAPNQRTYAPGEGGRISVSFAVGDRTGLQEKFITVITAGADEKAADLLLRVNIREYVALEPRWVVWGLDEKPVEKTITCHALQAQAVTLGEVKSTHPALTVRVETLEAGRRYRLHFTPVSTAKYLDAIIPVKVEIAGKGVRTFNVYAYIK